MSHDLEISSNGEVAFASLRQAAWHGLGTVFNEPVSTAEMLRISHLADWNVRLEPLVTSGRSNVERFEVNRTNPLDQQTDTLGVVGSRYNVFQNEELFDLGDNLTHGGQWETAGSIKDGTVVFGSLRLNDKTIIDGGGAADEHERYLLVSSSHNGSTNITASIVGLRVVCQNTLNMALRGAQQSFKIRHTSSVHGRVEEARRVLGLANLYFDEFDAKMTELIQQEVTRDEAAKIFEAAYPMPEKDVKGAVKRWETKMDTIWDIYDGPTIQNIYGTKLGVFNAMEERIDWYRKSRTGNEENMLAAAAGFDPVTNKAKTDLFNLVYAV